MAKRIISCILLLSILFLLSACHQEETMQFEFESIYDTELIIGSYYFMDFTRVFSLEASAIAEGKLLSAFGQPEYTSENFEDSFNYIIRATADSGESVILTVYNVGVVHIGAIRRDEFAKKAAKALIQYVNSFAPSDFSRTLYYLDAGLQAYIQVKDGKVTVEESPIPEHKIDELIDEWYG